MQCACTVLQLSVACWGQQYFSALSHKRHDFRKKKNKTKNTEHRMCVLIFFTILSETCLILRRTERDIKSVYRSLCKVPVIFVIF